MVSRPISTSSRDRVIRRDQSFVRIVVSCEKCERSTKENRGSTSHKNRVSPNKSEYNRTIALVVPISCPNYGRLVSSEVV